MAYISVTLSNNDPQPGSYSITVQDCDNSNEVIVASGLTNPNDFPFIFNTEDFLDYGDCFNYTITDTLTGCQSVGTYNEGGNVVPTPTPTPTPSSVVIDVIDVAVDIKSGSTIIDFTLTSSKPVSRDTLVSFDYILYKKDGSQKTIRVSGTILNGDDSVVVTKNLRDDFNTVDTTKHLIREESVDGNEFVLNKYSEKSIEGVRVTTTIYDFVNCCNDNDIIPITVDLSAVGDEGWVKKDGGVINYKGTCYKPLRTSKVNRSVATFFGPDYRSCAESICECIDPTPTPTPSNRPEILSSEFTLRKLASTKSTNGILANINNKDKDKTAFFHKGECYRLTNQDFEQGVNDPSFPVLESKDAYTSLNACKVGNSLPLDAVIRKTGGADHLKFGDSIKANFSKKITFNPKSFNTEECLDTAIVNAFTSCGQTATNPDIFVFYDASGSYSTQELFKASRAVRQWYTSLIVSTQDNENSNQGAFSGRLFEAPFDNREDALSLMCYPTLLSTTGGTINGETLVHGWSWTSSQDGNINSSLGTYLRYGGGVPNGDEIKLITGEPYSDGSDIYVDENGDTHFFSGHTHPSLYQESGQFLGEEQISTMFSESSTNPGNISENYLNDFNNGNSLANSIVIVISNEFGATIQEGFSGSTALDDTVSCDLRSPGRWKVGYDTYLKVWEHKKNLGLNSLNYLFAMPQTDQGLHYSASYTYGWLSLVEGGVFTQEIQDSYSTSYENENGETVNIEWPYLNQHFVDQGNYFDFSGLESEWLFDPSSVPYQPAVGGPFGEYYNQLPSIYQNGMGLKNFGLRVDPSLESFEVNILRDRLSQYINQVVLDSLNLYTLVECDPDENGNLYPCFDAGQSVQMGGQEGCLEVVENTLIGKFGYETGMFEVCREDYTILNLSESNFVLYPDCESCECEEGLNPNYRLSVDLINNGSLSANVTLHGVYDDGNGELTITESITLSAGQELTFHSFDFSVNACINLPLTLESISSEDDVDVLPGPCCDPLSPALPTPTPTMTPTMTQTPSQTQTQTPTQTQTQTPSTSLSPTPPPSQSQTQTQTPTQTPSQTQTQTPTQTPTQTQTPTPSISPGETPPPTPTQTPTPTASAFDCSTLSIVMGNARPIGEDCETQDIQVVVGLTPLDTEPVLGQIVLNSVYANTESGQVLLEEGTDYIFGSQNSVESTLFVTFPWQTYQNPEYLSYHFCITTAFGCEVCGDYTLDFCPCDKYHLFCDCRNGVTIGDIKPYNGNTVDYLGYSVPTHIDSICDLLPLAEVTQNNSGENIYTVTQDALLAAYSAHIGWSNDPNSDTSSTFLDVDGNGNATTSEMLVFLGTYGDGSVIVLNDYPDCFEVEYSCVRFPYDGFDYVVGDFYYIEGPGGYNSCYKYDGIFYDCENTVEHYMNGVVTNVNFVECEDCINVHFPTPTPTQTPTMTPTPSSTNCEIHIATLGTKTFTNPDGSIFNVNVNAVPRYFQPTKGGYANGNYPLYSTQEGNNEEIIPAFTVDDNSSGSGGYWRGSHVLPSLCTFYRSSSLWQTTLLEPGQPIDPNNPQPAPNPHLWDNMSVNNITQPIYISCDRSCRNGLSLLTDENSLPITWGEFKNNYLQYPDSSGGAFLTNLPLIVYDDVNDVVYSIGTEEHHELIDSGDILDYSNYNDDNELLYVDVVSNCEHNNDILVSDDGNGGWSFSIDGVEHSGNPTLSFKKGTTYRFHVIDNNKDFWIGMNEEDTVLANANAGNLCLNAVYIESISPNSLVNLCTPDYVYNDLTSSYCNYTDNDGGECALILHEKTLGQDAALEVFDEPSDYLGYDDQPINYNKTVIFRPSCDHDCSLQLFYYDRLNADFANDQTGCGDSFGLILINDGKDEEDCATDMIVTVDAIFSETTGLGPEVVIEWEDCEGNSHSMTVQYTDPGYTGPGPQNPQPLDVVIPGCIKKSTLKVLPNFITVKPIKDDVIDFEVGTPTLDDDGINGTNVVKRGKCWCEKFITEGENCWDACDVDKPNFRHFDKKTSVYTEKDGQKVMSEEMMKKLIGEIPKYFARVNPNSGECCDNCDSDGINVVNFKYWLAVNCCDSQDTIIVKVFDDPQEGDGFNLISRDPNDVDVQGRPTMTCYTFRQQILVGCSRDVANVTVRTIDFISNACETAVDDYETAVRQNLCLTCPDSRPVVPCQIPYGTIIGPPSTGYHEYVVNYGSDTGYIEMLFDAKEKSNRIQVYQVNPVSGQEILRADSLWVGGLLTGYTEDPVTTSYGTYLQERGSLLAEGSVTNLPVLVNNRDCETSWEVLNSENPTSGWDDSLNTTETLEGGVTVDDIPVGLGGNVITRQQGFPGQVGVSTFYPSTNSLACDPKVKLRFNKSTYSGIYKIKVWSHNDASNLADGWTLDLSCINPCGTETQHLWSPNNPCEVGNIECVTYRLRSISVETPPTFKYMSCPGYDETTVTLDGLDPVYICAVPDTVILESGLGNITEWTTPFIDENGYYQQSACEVTTATNSNFGKVSRDSNYTVPSSQTTNINFAYNSVNYDPNGIFSTGVLASQTNSSYFTANEDGVYNLSADEWLGLDADAYNGIKIKPYLIDIDTNEILSYATTGNGQGTVTVLPWMSQPNGVTDDEVDFPHNSPWWRSWSFDNVQISAGQRVAHRFDKVEPDSPLSQSTAEPNIFGNNWNSTGTDNNQNLYIYSGPSQWMIDTPDILDSSVPNSNLRITDFDVATSLTTLFIDSETPDLPQLCDYVYLDPCCTQPAEGYLNVLASNGDVYEYLINSEGQIIACPCCTGNSNPCQGEPSIYVPSTFAPVFGGNSVFEPVITPTDCSLWEMRIIDSGGALVAIVTSADGGWDGTTVGNDLVAVGTYICELTVQSMTGNIYQSNHFFQVID